ALLERDAEQHPGPLRGQGDRDRPAQPGRRPGYGDRGPPRRRGRSRGRRPVPAEPPRQEAPVSPMDYPYAFHIALDGNGLNALEGRAGVCVFKSAPVSGRYAYDVEYFDGMAGGHAVSVSPDRRVGFL